MSTLTSFIQYSTGSLSKAIRQEIKRFQDLFGGSVNKNPPSMQLELDMEQQTDSKSEKEYIKAVLSPCLFNLYAEYIMQNARLDEAQLESRLPGKISKTSDMQMTPPLWQKRKKS